VRLFPFLPTLEEARSGNVVAALGYFFNLRAVGAGPEALSPRRLVDFFYQGAQARGGVPGRLIYYLVSRRYSH